MSDFWSSSVGALTGLPQDAFARSFKKVPNGTTAIAKIVGFTLEQPSNWEPNPYMKVLWCITGGEFSGSTINQKIKVFGDYGDKHEQIRYRALNMLKRIYMVTGVKPKNNEQPTEQDMLEFYGRTAGIMISETEPNEKGITYNYISEVHPEKDFVCATGASFAVTAKPSQAPSASSSNEEDLIPF